MSVLTKYFIFGFRNRPIFLVNENQDLEKRNEDDDASLLLNSRQRKVPFGFSQNLRFFLPKKCSGKQEEI